MYFERRSRKLLLHRCWTSSARYVHVSFTVAVEYSCAKYCKLSNCRCTLHVPAFIIVVIIIIIIIFTSSLEPAPYITQNSSSELFIPSQRPSFEHEQNNIISLYYIWNTARYHCRYVMNSADRRTRVMEEIDRLSTVSTHIPAERHDFGNHVIITRSTAAADEPLPLLTAHNEQAADYFGKYHLLSDSSIMIIFMKN